MSKRLNSDILRGYVRMAKEEGVTTASKFIEWFRKDMGLSAGADRLAKAFNDISKD